MTALLQGAAWLIALAALLVAVYLLATNAGRAANRAISLVLTLLAANALAIGVLLGTAQPAQAALPAALIAMTAGAIGPALLLAAVALLKPAWLAWRRAAGWLPAAVLAVLPALLTLLDLAARTRLWYSGIPQGYAGGLLALTQVTQGALGLLLRGLDLAAAGLAGVLLAGTALFDSQAGPSRRRLAAVLLASLAAAGLLLLPERRLGEALRLILACAGLVLALAYAGFQPSAAPDRLPRGRMGLRLAVLVTTAAAALLVAVILFFNVRAGDLLAQQASDRLRLAAQSVQTELSVRLELQGGALQALSGQPDLLSAAPEQQTAALQALAAANPGAARASLLDANGRELRRSDGGALQDDSSQAWFQKAVAAEAPVSQLEAGAAAGSPSLVVAAPLRSSGGQLRGVAVLYSDASVLQPVLDAARPGKQGLAYLVDGQSQVAGLPKLAGSDDPGTAQATAALRRAARGLVSLTDPGGRVWWAYLAPLENGWSVVVQQPEAELLQPVRSLQQASVVLAVLVLAILAALVAWIIRQGLQPVRALTDAVISIRMGNVNRRIPLDSDDDLGRLAQALNGLIAQTRALIAGLEDRVAERTQAMERRAAQLQVAAEVSREAAGIRNLEQLLEHTARLISERFGYYHAGIFLLDPGGEYAILRSASSPGGQRMLATGHKLQVGREGIVGYVAAQGEPRIALDVGADAVYFDNPQMPETHSEAALPLHGHDGIIGVLDVQSTQAVAFSEEDVRILQILADQVALAIENARLITSSQQAVQELEALYGQRVEQAWNKRQANQPAAFAYDRAGVHPVDGGQDGGQVSGLVGGQDGGLLGSAQPGERQDGYWLEEPIQLRGRTLGKLVLRREREQGPWTQQEKELARSTIAQAALSLENARLLEEAQRSALREQQINAITAQVGSSANVDTVLQTTVRELGKALGAARTYIQITGNRS